MLEVVYYVAASLDGYIATPGGGIDWLAPFESSGEDYGYTRFYDAIDAVIVGSTTFRHSLTFGSWPYPGKPVWVFSSRALEVDRDDVTVTADAPGMVSRAIEQRGLSRAWLVGGGALAGSFQQAGLITEFIVSVIPIILGEGIPLFGEAGPPQRLRLLDTTSYPDGIVQLRYVPG